MNIMKKILIFAFVVLLVPSIANAGFETRSDAIAKREAKKEEELQRELNRTKALSDSVEELKKANAINGEIAAKMDILIENSRKNNELMETLLLRTEQ